MPLQLNAFTFPLQGKCSENVDKYIEYDFVLVLLDILLHKSQAYRHVLFNVKTKVALFYSMILICTESSYCSLLKIKLWSC